RPQLLFQGTKDQVLFRLVEKSLGDLPMPELPPNFIANFFAVLVFTRPAEANHPTVPLFIPNWSVLKTMNLSSHTHLFLLLDRTGRSRRPACRRIGRESDRRSLPKLNVS